MIELRFNENGLVPAVVQDASSMQVLMVAWMNRQAFELSLSTRLAHFWSRSRQALWKKGETSGNILYINEIRYDCDQDTLLLLVTAQGPACHTGAVSCFYRSIEVTHEHD